MPAGRVLNVHHPPPRDATAGTTVFFMHGAGGRADLSIPLGIDAVRAWPAQRITARSGAFNCRF